MRLLTHNLLACHARGCVSTSNNFPLQLSNVVLEVVEADMNPDFLRGFLPKVEWGALRTAARQLGDESLPEKAPDAAEPMIDENVLRALHHVLMEIHVIEGEMRCPNCAHVYGIKNGIPNMLLGEHEINK